MLSRGSISGPKCYSVLEKKDDYCSLKVVFGSVLCFATNLSTMLAIEPAKVGGNYNDRLPDYSIASMQNLQSEMRFSVKELNKIDDELLNDSNLLQKKVVEEILNYYAGSQDFSAGYIDTWAGHLPYIINQISGPLIDVPKVMQEQQAVVTEQDARDYLARLSNFDGFVPIKLEKEARCYSFFKPYCSYSFTPN